MDNQENNQELYNEKIDEGVEEIETESFDLLTNGALVSLDVEDFFKSAESLTGIERESLFVIDLYASAGENIRVSLPEDCGNWFDIPRAAIENIAFISLGCGGTDISKILVAMKFREGLDSLRSLFRQMTTPIDTLSEQRVLFDFRGYAQLIGKGRIEISYRRINSRYATEANIWIPQLNRIVKLNESNRNFNFDSSQASELLIQMRNIPENGKVWIREEPVSETHPDANTTIWRNDFSAAELVFKQTVPSGGGGGGTPVLRIVSLQAEFHTTNDDKDRNDGISETYLNGTTIVGQNQSWGKGLIFRRNNKDLGEPFSVNVPLSDCRNMSYRYLMDNDDGWNVRFRIYATLSDGTRKLVADEHREIANGRPRSGTINFSC